MSTQKKIAVPHVDLAILQSETSSLSDAFKSSVIADHVQGKVNGAFTGVFDTMRKHAVDIYRKYLAEAKGVEDDIKVSVMVGAFLTACKSAEQSHAGDTSSTWTNYKSKFKQAMERGINLSDNAAIGYTKLNTTINKINKEREAAAEAAAVGEHNQSEGGEPDGSGKNDAGDVPAGTGGTGSPGTANANDNAGTTPQMDSILSGLSAEAKAQLESMIQMAKDMESAQKGPKLMKVLNMAQQQLTDAHTKALSHLKAVS